MTNDGMFRYFKEDGDEYAVVNKRYMSKIIDKKYNYLLKKSGIPIFYRDIDFKNYKGDTSKKNVRKVEHYAKNFNDEKFRHIHLYLFGSQSCQKTSMAIAVGKELMHKGKEVYFVLAGDLVDKLMKAGGYAVNEEIEAYIQKLKNADMIILDDVFDTTKSTWWYKSPDLVVSLWDTFIRGVVASDTKIVMTSNIPVEGIKEKFGESLYHLIDRNFIALSFLDSYKNERKKAFQSDKVFKDIE